MKRLIGYTAALCLLAMMVGCGGVSSTGTLAYVSNSTGTGFTVFTVNTDGTLTKSSISPQNTVAAPKMLQFTANGKWAYFLDDAGNYIYGYTRAGNGDLSTLINNQGTFVGGAGGASSLVISSNSEYLIVALPSTLNGALAVFQIDSATGLLSNVSSPLQVGYKIQQLILNGTELYGLSPTQAAIVSFSVNTSTGAVTQSPNTASVGIKPIWMILSANGQFMYVLDAVATTTIFGTNGSGQTVPIGSSPNIYGFTASGGITSNSAMPGSPFPENPDAITGIFPTNPVAGVTSNDSRFLFIANRGNTSPSISAYTINSASGEPTEVKGSTTTVNGIQVSSASPFSCGAGCNPSFAIVSNTNNALYMLDTADNKIFQFAIDQNTGRIRALNPTFIAPDGPNPTWITIR